MKNKSQNIFRLNLKPTGLPLMLLVCTVLGVGVTAIFFKHQVNFFAMMMVLLCDVLIIFALFMLRPLVKDVRRGFAMVIAWYVCLLVSWLIYLLLPWIESAVTVAWNMPISHEITRIYLWVLGFFVVPIVIGLEQIIYVQTEVETLKIQSEVADLDFRIRPHFMFNSLNSVASLIAVDPVQAEEALMDLSDMIRTIFTEKRKLVPFALEYEIACKYLALEKMRMGAERLRDDWQVQGIDESILLPTLSLQPLIENAIYHGIETRISGGTVTIKASQDRNNLYIDIINPKPETIISHNNGSLTAQQNLVHRFTYLYQGNASITFNETEDEYWVKVRVPRYIEDNH